MNKPDEILTAIYDIVRLIPKGRVTSYGAVAAAVGLASGARFTGHALKGTTGINPRVPAHRVVNRIGMLTGKHHFTPPEKMQQLLEKEGVRVENDRVVNFKNLFWDPAEELSV